MRIIRRIIRNSNAPHITGIMLFDVRVYHHSGILLFINNRRHIKVHGGVDVDVIGKPARTCVSKSEGNGSFFDLK